MRRRRTAEETEDESGGLIDRVKPGSAEPTADDSGSLVDRVKGSGEPTTGESRSLFDRARSKYGLGVVLVATGAVLFFFPEPISSTVGLALIGVGALIWLVSWLR